MTMMVQDNANAGSIGNPSDLDRFGKIEARGIDYIPPAERHGRARELIAVWAASKAPQKAPAAAIPANTIPATTMPADTVPAI